MVQTYGLIAGRCQHLCSRLIHAVLLLVGRQSHLIQYLLSWEQLWQMCIRESNQSVGSPCSRLLDGITERVDSLQGQSIQEVEIHRCPTLVQHLKNLTHRHHRLTSVHHLQHFGAQVLHTQTIACKTACSKLLPVVGIQITGMALDGNLGALNGRRYREQVLVQFLNHGNGQCRRTAAAIVYLRDLSTIADMLSHQIDFLVQSLNICLYHLGLGLRIRVAAAVMAQVPAKGNMQVE